MRLSKQALEATRGYEQLKSHRDAVDHGLQGLRELQQRLTSDRVMVIHGRNRMASHAMFAFLGSLDLEPISWDQAVTQTGLGTPHNLDAVRAAMEDAAAIIALFTADDIAYLRQEHTESREDPAGQPRPNVLLETGMALALRPDDTIVVHLGRIRPASDLDGLNHVSLPDGREGLARRLAARCLVDMSSDKWRAAGDFDTALGD